jgi:predicted phosphodiesterase
MKYIHLIILLIALIACGDDSVIASDDSDPVDNLPVPVAEWTFDDPSNLIQALVGSDLVLHGTHEAIDGPTHDNGAVRIGPDSYYWMTHGLKPKANHTCINEYSILFDFRITGIDNWHALLQTNPLNSDDGDLFIHYPQGTVGIGAAGYSDRKMEINSWHRLILVVNNGNEYSLYLDGGKILNGQHQEVDSRFGLRPEMLLFADDNGENDWIDVAQVSLYEQALTFSDIQLIGPLHSPIPFLTQPWFQNVTSQGITVMWETKGSEQGILCYGTSDELGSEIISSVTKTNVDTYIHKAVLTGLKAATRYHCMVKVNNFTSEARNFKTAPGVPDAPFKVALWSDSHYASPWSKMASYTVETIQPDFLFNAGDISNTGNRRDDLGTVFLPFICGTIGSKLPFYTAFGNHDVGSHWGGGDLIRQYHDLPDELNSDPNAFDGSYLMMYSNVAFISIDWNRMESDLLPGGWFEKTLESRTVQHARFRFVFIHCAPYYERWQTAELPVVKDNLPMLVEKYNVDAVFSGHMHGYERGVKGGVQYITMGGGSYLDVNEQVGPHIYDHIIRGTNKENNPANFNNGLVNNILTIEVDDYKANILLHYFSNKGDYEGILEIVELDNTNQKAN